MAVWLRSYVLILMNFFSTSGLFNMRWIYGPVNHLCVHPHQLSLAICPWESRHPYCLLYHIHAACIYDFVLLNFDHSYRNVRVIYNNSPADVVTASSISNNFNYYDCC